MMLNFWRPNSAPLTSVLPSWSESEQTNDAVQDLPQYDFGLRPDSDTMDKYPLIHADCKFQLVDVYLSATLKHTFKSRANKGSNVSYIFPLPPDASIHAFTAYIDNRVVEGVVKEKNEARNEFNTAVAGGHQAALLQQQNIEVFKLSLGNVMPEQTVTVRISFVSVVSYEGAAPDTLRLTFPAYIAPRYGTPPTGIPASGSALFSSLDFACSVDAGSNITTISSPSHPITTQLGSLGTNLVNGCQFDPSKALVTLSSPLFLEKDIVLIINYKDMDRPRCMVESYPSEDGKSDTVAYALTLVPKFKLPPLSEQEYIFLVDRSGSMAGGKMNAVRSALQIMLKSLPNKGSSFNVVSFGDTQNTLWRHSVPYTAVNVEMAAGHVDRMAADMGGTQMKSALVKALSCRIALSPPTNVFVLTDGESWDLEGVQKIIREQVEASTRATSFLRVFCMGIGDAVSKAMCEGIANAGNGSAVYVTENEKPDRKLINLIRAAQIPPVTDLRIDWGIPEVQPTQAHGEDAPLSQWNVITELSFFDDAADLSIIDDNEVQLGPSEVCTMFQQHPRTDSMPIMMPGRRYSFYAVSQRSSHRKDDISEKVALHGLVLGQPISLEVPVVPIGEVAGKFGSSRNLVHLIAARALIQDYDEQGKENRVLDMGLRYGLISSQTSFVAIDQAKQVLPVDWLVPGREPSQPSPPKYSRTSAMHSNLSHSSTASRQNADIQSSPQASLGWRPRAPKNPPTSTEVKKPKSDVLSFPYKARGLISRPAPTSANPARSKRMVSDSILKEDIQTPPGLATVVQNPLSEQPKILMSNVESFAREQAFDGSFTPKPDLYDLLTGKRFAPDQPLVVKHLRVKDTIKTTLWCTVLVLAYLKVTLPEEEEAWSLFADKSVNWVKDILSDAEAVDDAEVWLMEARKEANQVLTGK